MSDNYHTLSKTIRRVKNMKVLKKLHLTQLFLLLDTSEKKGNFFTMGSVSKIAPKIAHTHF